MGDKTASNGGETAFPGRRTGLVIVVGSYGSGKTEFSVNYALWLAGRGVRVSIADLDIVNPYFRCREAAALMEEAGIRVVIPPGDRAAADLPIIVPEISGMLRPPEGEAAIFDVGGDPVGARLLAGIVSRAADLRYELWQVLNCRRPFTGTVEGCLRMKDEIEGSSKLRVTGFISNTHLVSETTAGVVLDGYRLAAELSGRTGVPVVCVSVMEEIAADPAFAKAGVGVFAMKRRMLPPWIARGFEGGGDNRQDPAPRAVPLGRRTGAT